ncbi:MAG: hypothetical protein J6P45_04155 [Lachnospiraceae bacterium]|nr:hypothetical protein [Lachnospiraceae bacterium]
MALYPYNIPEGWIFVPARRKTLSGLDRLINADVIIFDLEDSLKEDEKEEGLRLIGELPLPDDGRSFFVRLNSERLYHELDHLRDTRLDGFMIPKFEGVQVLDEYDGLLKGRRVAALIETPAGVARLPEYAGDKRINAFAFGAEDFGAALGIDVNERAVLYARSMIVLYAAMHKKVSVDMISKEVKDKEAFDKDLVNTLELGFNGKLLIHPMQLEMLCRLKSSVPREKIRDIIDRFEKDPSGALMIDGRLYERMHIDRLKKLVKGE